jgi:glycosyltransferase involved in cell wall biosynthesis
MKNILFITRPLSRPWDEASKNFTKDLVSHIKHFHSFVLTNTHQKDIAGSTTQIPLYSKPVLTKSQKLRLLRLRSLVKRRNISIVHFLFSPTMMNATFFKKIIGVKNVKTVQTAATIQFDKYSTTQLKKILFADRIVTYSNYAAHKLSRLGFSNISVIYPGIDMSTYKLSQQKPASLMAQFKLNKKDFIVVYPGEYVRLGATDMLVESVKKLNSEIPELKLIFACRLKNEADRKKRDAIMAYARNEGFENRIIHTGTLHDMQQLYNIADVVVFPVANMKGKFDVPLAVIEAMACAKPVVISDLEVLSEFSNNNNSVVVEAGSADAYLGAVQQLHANKQHREKIGKAGREFVEKNFSIEHVAEKYEEIYTELLS